MSTGALVAILWVWFLASLALVAVVVATKVGWLTDSSLSDDEVAERFARRHALGVWIALLPGFGFFAAIYLLTRSDSTFSWVYAATAAICFLSLFLYVAVLYRCPRCGAHPSSSVGGTTGLLFFPKKCPRCRAPLLPRHRWAQD